MTTKDYVKFAEVLGKQLDRGNINLAGIRAIAEVFSADNPRFDSNLFISKITSGK